MKAITPQIQYKTRQSYRDYEQSYGKKSKLLVAYFKTYRDLKKELGDYLAQAYCPEHDEDEVTVFVVRSKRGQWGEYCETWAMRDGKPTIIKEGWS